MIKDLWTCRKNIFFGWIFFFSLSLCSNSPLHPINLALISLGSSVGISFVGILLVRGKQ